MNKKIFTLRTNGIASDYEIVRNGVVVETLKFHHYDEDDVEAYIDKCENAYKVITDIKETIDMVINLDGSYHTFKNAVETLEQLDVPNFMSYDVNDLERKLIRMMVWLSTPLKTTESREISMAILSMTVKELNEVTQAINEILVE